MAQWRIQHLEHFGHWRNFGQWRKIDGVILGIMANRMTQSRCQNEYLPKWRNGAIGDTMAQFWASWRIEWRNLGHWRNSRHHGAIGMSWRNLGHHDESNDAIWALWRNLRHHGVIGWLAQFGTSWRKMNVQNRLKGLRHFLMAHFSHRNSPEFMVEIGYRDLYGYSTPRYP